MFIYMVVNIGSEKLLKEEVAIKYPEFSFAYSRPGFITFKDNSQKIDLNTKLDLIFARSYGISLIKIKEEEIEDKIKEYKFDKIQRFSIPKNQYLGEVAKIGDIVLDIIEVKDGEYWLGLKRIYEKSWRYPGANPNLILPQNSPSRAYLKIAEALLWSGYSLKKGTVVLELGSAPGGASYAMLERGFRVYGVDNAIMNESVLENPMFTHIKEPMQKVRGEEIPSTCNVLVSDVNVLPSLILAQIKRFLAIKKSIDTVYYTLKIGDRITVLEVLKHIETFKTFGFREVIATQLPSNKSEILLYGKK